MLNGFARLLFVLLGVVLIVYLNNPSAQANEAAERRIVGFSPDGRYFAFEQFGTRDGSGFPYADIFITDLEHDRWVKGTPLHARLNKYATSPQAARRKAQELARPILEKLKINQPGRIVASRQIGELGEPAKSLVFKPYYYTPPEGIVTLKLEVVDLPAVKSCENFAKTAKGFAVTLLRAKGKAKEIYRDQAVPTSRICPVDYGISDIIAYDIAQNKSVFVALISLFQRGFEGPDRRFLTLPVPISK
jgi:predicted secreted protein